jgi:hypothetical protein
MRDFAQFVDHIVGVIFGKNTEELKIGKSIEKLSGNNPHKRFLSSMD